MNCELKYQCKLMEEVINLGRTSWCMWRISIFSPKKKKKNMTAVTAKTN